MSLHLVFQSFSSPFTLALLHLAFTLTAQFLTPAQQHPQKRKHNYRHTNGDPFLGSTHLIVTGHEYHIHHSRIQCKYGNGNVWISKESHICTVCGTRPVCSAKVHQTSGISKKSEPFAPFYSIF